MSNEIKPVRAFAPVYGGDIDEERITVYQDVTAMNNKTAEAIVEVVIRTLEDDDARSVALMWLHSMSEYLRAHLSDVEDEDYQAALEQALATAEKAESEEI